jgi:predicted dienelactone hydrolase
MSDAVRLAIVLVSLLAFDSRALAEANSRTRSFNVGYTVVDFEYPNSKQGKPLTAAVWYPTTAESKEFQYGGPTKGKVAIDGALALRHGPYPLLVFAHGYGGTGLSSVFLTEQLAAQGWIVVAPDHHDRHSIVRIRTGRNNDLKRRELFQHAQEISSSSPSDRHKYLYRLDEMSLALNGIFKHSAFGESIDQNRIAVGGHSFGGYTALGLCGTIREYYDPRIKAVLLFSTGAGGYLFSAQELQKVRIPAMLFIGEREREQERGSKTMIELSRKIYLSLSGPKYFLEIDGASHFSFNDQLFPTIGAWLLSGNEKIFKVIRSYSIAFLEKHVAGKRTFDRMLLLKNRLLTRYETNQIDSAHMSRAQ